MKIITEQAQHFIHVLVSKFILSGLACLWNMKITLLASHFIPTVFPTSQGGQRDCTQQAKQKLAPSSSA